VEPRFCECVSLLIDAIAWHCQQAGIDACEAPKVGGRSSMVRWTTPRKRRSGLFRSGRPLMDTPERPDDSFAPAQGGSIDKSHLPSRHTTIGPERAPHRSFLYAMGLSAQEIAQPFVGVVTTWNEAAPCNIALGRQAQAVKRGVSAAGSTPREFTTITVTDGIAMGHAAMKASLVSREVIADPVELTMCD